MGGTILEPSLQTLAGVLERQLTASSMNSPFCFFTGDVTPPDTSKSSYLGFPAVMNGTLNWEPNTNPFSLTLPLSGYIVIATEKKLRQLLNQAYGVISLF